MSAEGPFRLTPDDLLAVVGPAWSAMSLEQRIAYGRWDPPGFEAWQVWVCAGLLDLVRLFPLRTRDEGLAAVAERFDATPDVIELARAIDALSASNAPPQTAARVTLAEKPSAPSRSLMEAA